MNRLSKELVSIFRTQNSKKLLDNEYIVSPESTLDNVKVLFKAPDDSLYRHKFIRLNIKIPEDYPFSPPMVSFINHDGARIHPNMYEDGKCCATILNTWGDRVDEKWTSSMCIETIIMAFMSLLDNQPYAHEPGVGGDESYNTFVSYQTWYTCLFEYLKYEEDELFTNYINEYIQKNFVDMIGYIDYFSYFYPRDVYYTSCYEIDEYIIDFEDVKGKLFDAYCVYSSGEEACTPPPNDIDINSCEYECNICYDTEYNKDFCFVLSCNHKFHIQCLEKHIETNPLLCPMCRTIISIPDYKIIKDEWITCMSGKRYRKYGRNYNALLKIH
jgi:ubiquitin-protein ligase